MIKETTKKMHLLAFTPRKGRQVDKSKVPTATVFIEKGKIQFGRYAIEAMGMNGRFTRFYYDPVKKVIAWKVEAKIDQADMKLWRLCRTHQNGVWSSSIGKMIELFNLDSKGLAPVYRNVPIQKYRELELLSKPNDTYFFVELNKEYAVTE